MAADTIKVAELFAGVGGFRLALDGYSNDERPDFNRDPAGPFKTVWANQWEPPGTEKRQFAWRCYERRFGDGSCLNKDIAEVLDAYEEGSLEIPDVQMVVGGFPCQDYSVAKPLSLATGIKGKKGVLWWELYRFIRRKQPRFVLLENVDRLLKSPVSQRGRDFAIILSCLAREGYSVEWRVINAADYGMPQKRRRVFIFGIKDEDAWDLEAILKSDGVLASAFHIKDELTRVASGEIGYDTYLVSETFGVGDRVSVFQNAGVMQGYKYYTARAMPDSDDEPTLLKDIVVDDSEVPEGFFIPEEKLDEWAETRRSKSIKRTTSEGFTYTYSEGSMAWPDSLDKPARTILTGEGGAGASRMKHAIIGNSGRFRRLVPDELDQIQMFPKGWTEGMSDGHRAFCMGNALVVGVPHRIGESITAKYFTQG